MSKSLKKILVTSASLLMMASVGAGVNNLVKPVQAHSLIYKFWHTPTGKLYHGITLGGRYYPAGTKLYNTNYASGGYGAAMGPSPYAPRYIIPAWARKRGHAHHRKVLYQYQIRPNYGKRTYNRLFKRLVREMKAHGTHYDSSNETSKLSHKGRYIELTGTNTGVVTNGLRALWPDQALKLLHKMYGHTAHHHYYYRPTRHHHIHKTRAYRNKNHKSHRVRKHAKRRRVAHKVFKDSNNNWLDKETATMQKDRAREDKAFAEIGTASSKQYQHAEHIANEHSLQDWENWKDHQNN